MAEPFCVGLTGGIGCGKSSAATILRELGAAVIDTDEIAHELTQSGGAALPDIAARFGADYIMQNGALDRGKMRRLVFARPEAKAQLESILHPLIRREAQARVAGARAPYVVLVVPLLLETGAYKALVRRVLVIDCDEALQIARTAKRSGMTAEEVRAVMAAQISRDARLAAADDVLVNDSDLVSLRRGAVALHQQYLALASAHRSRPAGN
ncbi:MAG: dephospho-CoA kinase [Betaproteobacteria bacterium]